jgi:uncharacterized protein (DUF58 family)
MNASSLLKKVRKIEIKSKGLSNHIFAGEYHTAFKGTGMAFSEVREYQSGDDIRSIDWNVTARYNTPFVKIFEEEREMTVMLLIDVSASGDFGTNKQYKKDLATEIAAVLAFSAIKNNDKVGLLLFSNDVEKYVVPKKGKSHVLRIIREIVSLEPDSKGTDIAMALEYFNSVIKKRSICFLLSDFTSTPFSKPLKIASKKHDIVGVRVHDKRESEMPNIGLVPMQDMETDKLVYVDTSNKEIRLDYSKTRSQKIKELNKIFETNGVDLVQISTGEDYVKPLVNFFKRRGKRK